MLAPIRDKLLLKHVCVRGQDGSEYLLRHFL